MILSIFFWCAKENARKRKHEPFPLDTRPLCRNTDLLPLKKQLGTCARKPSAHAGLCGRLCRPSPRNDRFAPFVAAKLV